MKVKMVITDEQWATIQGLYEAAAHTYGYVRANPDYRYDDNVALLGDSLAEVVAAFPDIKKR